MGNDQSSNSDKEIQLHTLKDTQTEAYGEVRIVKDALTQVTPLCIKTFYLLIILNTHIVFLSFLLFQFVFFIPTFLFPQELFCVRSFSFEDDSKLREFVIQAQSHKLQLQSAYIAELCDISCENKSEFCSNFHSVSLRYCYYNESVYQVLNKMKSLKVKLTENDIYHFADSVTSALAVLSEQGFAHGDIRPQTILLSRQDATYKLTDIQFITHYTQYSRLLLGTSDNNYLSPQLFSQLHHRIANPICDELKSDIFSLGLMCLEMASMESLDGVYDWENYVIEEVKVESMILKLKETGSSESFIEFLLRMLQIEEVDRISLNEIIEYLEPLRPTFSQGAFARFGERSSILSHSMISNQVGYYSSRPPANANYNSLQSEGVANTMKKPHVTEVPQIQEDYVIQNEKKDRIQESTYAAQIPISSDYIHNKTLNSHNDQTHKTATNRSSSRKIEEWEQKIEAMENELRGVLTESNKVNQDYQTIQLGNKQLLDNSKIDSLIKQRKINTQLHQNNTHNSSQMSLYLQEHGQQQASYQQQNQQQHIQSITQDQNRYTHSQTRSLSQKKHQFSLTHSNNINNNYQAFNNNNSNNNNSRSTSPFQLPSKGNTTNMINSAAQLYSTKNYKQSYQE